MNSIGKTKIKRTIFWCEELLVGDIQGLPKGRYQRKCDVIAPCKPEPRGIRTEDLVTTVLSPDNMSHNCYTVEVDDGYSIKFSPLQMGIHTASVKKLDKHVPGSPFKFAIEPFDDGHRQVNVSGSGIRSGSVGKPAEVSVTTVEAGAGALSLSTEGPRSTHVDFHEVAPGVCGVSYLCSAPGDYKVSVKFNGNHVPNSPFSVCING